MKRRKYPPGTVVLCPILERPCPDGEEKALLCHRLMREQVEVPDDFSYLIVQCPLDQEEHLFHDSR